MRSHPVAMLACLVLAVGGGCRTDPAVTALENENRQLEDVIYQQRDIIEQYRRQLESCRAGGGRPSESVGTVEGPSLSPPRPTPARKQGESTSTPKLPERLEIEVPEKPTPPGQVPDTLRPRGEGAPPAEEAPPFVPKSSGSSGVPARQTSIAGGNARVARIALAKVVAWDNDAKAATGDEGLSLLVQPFDATGALVKDPAAVSVVVLDPAKSGVAARVARWDFSADEVSRLFHSTPAGDGIQLEMVWPAAPPANSRLHLFVRYWADDGRNVETDQEIDVSAAEVRGPNWEPAGPELSLPEEDQTAAEAERDESASSAQAASPSLRTAAVPSRTPTLAPPRRPEWSPDRP